MFNLGIVKLLTMPRKSSTKSAQGERGKEAGESMSDALGFQCGTRACGYPDIENNENIMKKILEVVTEATVTKLISNPNFTDTY